ncbi:hypothetical protein [Thalassococcus sp. S3]|uniref:helix-turn-helix transcriptional regulator n=1 Tax=Thalassococcus sp. S3 TaxID=2017482 RepID=UPI001024072A|nr:hypothetical protein [Thalassococcus sp. S3]QBF32319.1 hypothetical protein CFI11_14000 [Thalassococcus sp. S3]
MSEYEPEFVIDELVSLPDPLDSNIASVSVWTDANDPSEAHDVLLSASVGSDVIQISVDGDPLETEIAIYQAEVLLTFANCTPSYGPDYSELFGRSSQTIEQTTISKQANSEHGNVKLSATPSADFAIDQSQEHEIQRSGVFSEATFEHHTSNAVRFGNWKERQAQSGQRVPRYRGWSVTRRDRDDVSGVAAILRVKKNWIDFIEVSPKPESRLGKLFSVISKSTGSDDMKKKELFEALLKELTLQGLQSPSDKSMANLAIAGFIVRPKDDKEEMLVSNNSKRHVHIPEALLLPILRARAGTQEQVYKSVLSASNNQKNNEVKDFTPQSGYLDAKEAYYDLCLEFREHGAPFELAKLQAQYGEAVITDLKYIGALASDRRNTVYFISPYPDTEPEHAFDALALSQETVRFAETLVRDNPEISGTAIGLELAEHLGRDWSRGSAKRYGGQLKNWALRRGSKNRGRSLIIRGLVEERVLAMLADGRPATEIGELLKISPETVRRYDRARKKKGSDA